MKTSQKKNLLKSHRMHVNYKNLGVLPSIIMGQAVLESNFGQSQLASKYNNLLGLKHMAINQKSI